MTTQMFKEIETCFNEINQDRQCRAVVVSGSGKSFSAGIDFMDMMSISSSLDSDLARKAMFLRNKVLQFQASFNSIDACSKPVIASIHGACLGAGIELISATDIRYCSSDAFFSIREVNIGMAADLGGLQRLPRLIGNDSLVRELAYTGRDLPASEAKVVMITDNYR